MLKHTHEVTEIYTRVFYGMCKRWENKTVQVTMFSIEENSAYKSITHQNMPQLVLKIFSFLSILRPYINHNKLKQIWMLANSTFVLNSMITINVFFWLY